MISIFHVACYILNNAGSMTSMKLHKLCYYAQAWSLAWDGVPLFDEDFQAWANGPTCPELFETHRGIFLLEPGYYDDYKECSFTAAQTETMDVVLKDYGDKEPRWLSELTHKERPWRETRIGVKPGEPCDRVIPKQLLQEYYEGLADEDDEDCAMSAEKKVIEEKVSRLLSQYGYHQDRDNYVDIVDLVKKEGFCIRNAWLSNSEDGFLAMNADSKIIGVNVNRSMELKRFIIAHEFAHSVLHCENGQDFLHRENRKEKDDAENDADYFAAALLMPFQSFKRVYEHLKAARLSKSMICSSLAGIYRVESKRAAERIKEIASFLENCDNDKECF